MDPQGNQHHTGTAHGKQQNNVWIGLFIKGNNDINNDKTVSWSLRATL